MSEPSDKLDKLIEQVIKINNRLYKLRVESRGGNVRNFHKKRKKGNY